MSHNQHRSPRVIGGVIGGPQYPWHGEPADTDIYVRTTGPMLPDAGAALKLYRSDPAKDRMWFRRHRAAKIRIRRITEEELAVLGRSAGPIVYVWMTKLGPVREYRGE